LPVNETVMIPAQLFELTNNRIVVTSITPAADGGFLIRLFNPEQSVQQTSIQWKSLQPKGIVIVNSGERKTNTDEIKLVGMAVLEIQVQ